ncbi:MAG: UDP-N-acetylmuramoyl-L-alanine--D-glutamate ligase [Pseudomonadota bacterium]
MTVDNAYQDTTQRGVDLVVGLGASGYSCARFLTRQGREIRVLDSRLEPPYATRLRETLPDVDVAFGEFDDASLSDVGRVITSPGIPSSVPLLQRAFEQGLEVISDIELFAQAAPAHVVGITGSNGKSTVTSWIAHVLNEAGFDCLCGGNLGVPALDLLDNEIPDYYVLELSSFQLERTHTLHLKAAAILNIGVDHIDHHGDLESYQNAKWRILDHCETAVLYAPLAQSAHFSGVQAHVPNVVLYGADAAGELVGNESNAAQWTWHLSWSAAQADGQPGQGWLCREGQRLLPTSVLKVMGRHNHLNALAVLALAECCGLEFTQIVEGMTSFAGLDHRMQWVGESRGVTWINDSKGTNSDATIAALSALDGGVVLIAGGQAKGDDFSRLADALVAQPQVSAVILIGADADRIERALSEREYAHNIVHAASMEEAVSQAARHAREGDTVLLSPACASFDMFDNYEARGEAFMQAWRALI